MRSFVKQVLQSLLANGSREVLLDEVGDAIGAHPVSQSEIDEILTLLEQAGCVVGDVTPNVRQHLHEVLRAARALRGANPGVASGHESAVRIPNVAAIATQTGLSVGEVRAALLYAQVLSR